MTWLQRYRLREFFRTSLWIYPMFGMALALVIVRVVYRIDLLTSATADFDSNNIRNVLCALASSMFTFIVFVSSALLLAVQMASTQMTPRIIPLALNAPSMKMSLTVFVFTFTYLLAVILRITSSVPMLTTQVALVCCLASMGFFLILVDKVGKFVRPSGALDMVALRGRRVIESIYVRKLAPIGKPSETDDFLNDEPLRTIVNPRSGVVLALDSRGLASLAQQYDCIIEMIPQVGDFVAAGEPLFRIFQGGSNLPECSLFQSVAVGLERTLEQDATFAFRIIVDIASKGLSPAINDPTTAVLAIDQIHRLLRNVGSRDLNEGRIRDASGRLRFVYRTPEWEDFVCLAVTEIRHYGAESIQVTRRLRAMLENLIQTLPQARSALLHMELEILKRSAPRFFYEPEDQALANISDFQGVGGKFGPDKKHGEVEKVQNPSPETLPAEDRS